MSSKNRRPEHLRERTQETGPFCPGELAPGARSDAGDDAGHGCGDDAGDDSMAESPLYGLTRSALRHLGLTLYKYALKLARDGELAEDLVQECFRALLEKSRHDLDQARSLQALAMRILYNKWVDRCRRQLREDRSLQLGHDLRGAPGQAGGNLAARLDIERIIGAERHHPDLDAFLRRHYDGEDYHQLAAALDITVDAARQRVCRGRRRIRAILRRSGYGGGQP